MKKKLWYINSLNSLKNVDLHHYGFKWIQILNKICIRTNDSCYIHTIVFDIINFKSNQNNYR
ncbi:hypothetical protein DERF_001370 [Dermatophagoides farinae]|uniref:Uncharacterized protein n=1 Tax=Dermatophagoides farinae TaxID=6954 RepID=A0A922LCY9_DERFA|nr:hypothetical protein DERF_001370 [Dermatophagoides farinae]